MVNSIKRGSPRSPAQAVKGNTKEHVKMGGVGLHPRMMWSCKGRRQWHESCSAPRLFVFSDLSQFCCYFGVISLCSV